LIAGIRPPGIVSKRIDPWIVPAFATYPPSAYSALANDWYYQGKMGWGGQLNVVPNVDCWTFYTKNDGRYWNLQYGPNRGNGTINPECR
jgi:hypothetical protein